MQRLFPRDAQRDTPLKQSGTRLVLRCSYGHCTETELLHYRKRTVERKAAPQFTCLYLVAHPVGLVFPKQTKCFTMPTQQGFWLDKEEGLLPYPNCPCHEHKEESIYFRTCRSIPLTPEYDELLSQEGVFRYELRLASAKVCMAPGSNEEVSGLVQSIKQARSTMT